MPILTPIDYKTGRGRLAIGIIYTVLSLGGVMMVYPFLMMVAMSFSNEVDATSRSPWPRYIASEELLYRKYMATRYLSFQKFLEARNLNRNYLSSYYRFDDLADLEKPVLTPALDPHTGKDRKIPLDIDSPAQRQRARDWRAFTATLPESHIIPGSLPWLTPRYQNWLEERYGTVEALALAYDETVSTFSTVTLPFYNPYIRSWKLDRSRKVDEWREFFAGLPEPYRIPLRMDGEYQRYLTQTIGGLETLNRLSGRKRESVAGYRLQETIPSNAAEAIWWKGYLATRLPTHFLDPHSITPAYRAWLAGRYGDDIGTLNARYSSRYRSFEEIGFSSTKPANVNAAADWSHFVIEGLPFETLRLDTVEARWDRWLKEKYRDDPAALSRAHGLALEEIREVYLPIPESDRLSVRENRWQMTRRYLTANYALVIDHLLLNGRAFLNTGVLCAAMVLSQLTINPFCAYALSRFNLGYRYKVILFLIATMAFPAEVMMIPNFLNLKSFGLLNTYWALILPSLVSGYYIFVMKGFFDSLGKELFEAAQIDGAGEVRMFFQIAIPLSKPIFAVKALNAFMAAYGGFMWAFLVCQDRELWTVMVHLYEFQQTQTPSVVMSTLVVASIPTLLVYIFCQKIIMRGIILPTLK